MHQIRLFALLRSIAAFSLLLLLLALITGLAVSIISAPAVAQNGQEVNIYTGPPQTPLQSILFYSGSNLTYVCYAKSLSSRTTLTIASSTNANPAVLTSTGHGFFTTSASARPQVSISGGTGNWTVINTDWLLTSVDADTFTLANPTTGTNLDSTSLGALAGTVVLETTAPRTTQKYWSIRRLLYDGSNNLVATQWSFGDAGTKGIFASRCSNRAGTEIEWK